MMDLLDQVAVLHIAILQEELLLQEEEDEIMARAAVRRRRRPKRFWVRSWLTANRRLQFGHYDQLMRELRMEDTSSFFNYLRMEPQMFDELLHRVGHRIQKHDTNFRKALSPGLRLALTIRHLAAGDKYPSLQYQFRVSRYTITKIIPQVGQL
jgi:hypothetical protein